MQKARRHPFPYGYRAPTACRHTVSGSIPPLSGIFPTFPYGTGALSVIWEYLALEGGSPEFQPASTYSTVLGNGSRSPPAFHLQGFHLLRLPFPEHSVRCGFVTPLQDYGPAWSIPRPRIRNARKLTRTRFGLVPFRSPLLRKSLRFLFLWILRWFSSPRLLAPAYAFSRASLPFKTEGFPHSDIPG
jgi:hypothetical protein